MPPLGMRLYSTLHCLWPVIGLHHTHFDSKTSEIEATVLVIEEKYPFTNQPTNVRHKVMLIAILQSVIGSICQKMTTLRMILKMKTMTILPTMETGTNSREKSRS